MRKYVLTKVVQLLAVSFIISVAVFLLVHLLPGDPTVTILGPDDTPQNKAILLHQLGLDKGLVTQYWTWLDNVFHGNLGRSFTTRQSVTNALSVAVPIDVELIVVSQVMALVVAIPLALLAARRPNRYLDRIATTTSFGLLALPVFVISTIGTLILAVKLHALPATGFTRLSQSFGDNLRSVLLPSIALALGSVAIYYRLLRSDLVGTLQEDFVTMARSKGLSTFYVLTRHALRPSSFSLLAGLGISIGSLFTGAFVVEYIFQLPGIGYQLWSAINARDYLVVQGMALVAAIAYLFINFVIDFLLTTLDPRVRRA
ncbi:MAG TPA: ABC transporter permease [Acidimicrobiales bacterium]|nr:ABC transporter permease [Acidimicrobiales bacterium]